MGEIAEMMLNGDMCECCGVWLEGEGEGIPGYCSAQCARDRGAAYFGDDFDADREHHPSPPRADKTNCPTCAKRVKVAGLADHMRDVHGGAQ